jgi:AAA family ATP:ADP antiporter
VESLPTGARADGVTTGDRLAARLLRPFAQVEPAEAITAAVMTLTVFALLTAYYLLKTAREPLILLHGGAEVKSYASAGQSLLLLGVVPAYAALARRVGRMRLVASVYLFFGANLLIFAGLARANASIGVAFYLWVGVFSVTAIAQFWSFANDIYSAEQGKRLFAVLGIGSSIGAVAGAVIARRLAVLGPQALMLGAALILLVCVGLFAWVESRERHNAERGARTRAEEPIAADQSLAALFRDRYLLQIAALTFLLNCVNSTGEYVLDRSLLSAASGAAAHGVAPQVFVAQFKAEFFGWVNVVGVVLQLFVVSRVLKHVGVRRALLVLPLVACASYGFMLVAPVLALIRIGKIAENSLDYSLQNTARQALFLVTTRAQKYLGKAAIDTFVVRMGDVCSALLVLTGNRLALPTQAFAAINLGLIALWLVVVAAIGREHSRRSLEDVVPALPVAAQ